MQLQGTALAGVTRQDDSPAKTTPGIVRRPDDTTFAGGLDVTKKFFIIYLSIRGGFPSTEKQKH